MTVRNQNSQKVAAIIVTYHPNSEVLRRLVLTLCRDQILIIIADNGGAVAALSGFSHAERLTVLDLQGNQGIGAAINAGIAAAKNAHVEYVITFDQDSNPSPGMVERLVAAFELQTGRGIRVAAVGPQFVDNRQNPALVHPFVRLGVFGSGHRYCSGADDLVNVDVLITSGCLTSLDVLSTVGRMNPDYFVDYTDIEWAFRAKSQGFMLFGVCSAQMEHELGDGRVRKIIGINVLEYSPIRRYYYARNTIAVSALRYTSLRWKFRLVFGLFLRCITLFWAPRTDDWALLGEYKMFFRGLFDGMRGVKGAFRELPRR